MALLTPNDLMNLNQVVNGSPFCVICSKSTMTPNSLDYVVNGQPFWAVTPAAGGCQIKSVDGVLTAGVGKVFGLAMASVKKVLGVSNV